MPEKPMIGPFSKVVGQNVDRIRRVRDISVNSLSRHVGIHRTAISQIIHGNRRVDADELVKFATALNVEVGQLLGLQGGEVIVIPAVTVPVVTAESLAAEVPDA